MTVRDATADFLSIKEDISSLSVNLDRYIDMGIHCCRAGLFIVTVTLTYRLFRRLRALIDDMPTSETWQCR